MPTVNSKASVTRSPIPWKMVVPPESTTLAHRSLRMSTSPPLCGGSERVLALSEDLPQNQRPEQIVMKEPQPLKSSGPLNTCRIPPACATMKRTEKRHFV